MAAKRTRRHLRLVAPAIMTPLPTEFRAFLDYLTRNQRRAPNTIRARRAALRSFVTHCESHGIADPVRADYRTVQDWQAGLTYADATVENYTAAVRTCFRWLASRSSGVLAENPADELATVRVPFVPRNPISDEDLDLALTAARAARQWPLYTWLLLEAGTGIRPVQIASLTHHRVRYNPDGRALLTVSGKGATMVVVAGPDIAAELRRFTRDGRGPLWLNAHGRPVNADNVMSAVNKHLRGLGIAETSHSLRRWFGSNAHDLTGHDARTVQEMLGHSDMRPTMRYLRPDARQRGDVADQLAARLVRREPLEGVS